MTEHSRSIAPSGNPPIVRTAACSADDEECANRLADTLKLLDSLADHVPDHLVSREELRSASEILALLVGWFAGGIGGPPSGEDIPAADGTERLNNDHPADPAARRLRQMLDALQQHRAAQANTESGDRLKSLDQILAMLPLPPLWLTRINDAAEDGIEQSLLASIREEGWRAFAEGGLDAMRQLADRASGEDDRRLTILDHQWDGIGTDRHGHWVC